MLLRRFIAIHLLIMLLINLCSCTEQSVEYQTPVYLFSEEFATDELVIYNWENAGLRSTSSWQDMLNTVIRSFRQKHPEIDLIYRELPHDEYDDILTVELMAGKGPDLILWENMRGDLFADPTKVIQANAFMDLDPLFQQDPAFSYDDYTPAFDAGLYNGGRYYVPLSYFVTYTVVDSTRLEDSGFPFQQYQSYEEYTSSLSAYLNGMSISQCRQKINDFSLWREQYLYSSGLQLIDYETGTVLPDREGLRMVSEFCKEMQPYFTELDTIDAFLAGKTPSACAYEYFTEEGRLFITQFNFWQLLFSGPTNGENSWGIHTQVGVLPTLHSQKPVAIPAISAAIRNSTPNLQNAYIMLQYLLSDSLQGELDVSAPVNKDTLYRKNRKWYRYPENYEILDTLMSDVLPYQQFSPKLWELYVQYMTPYWEDNASYGQCVSELEAMLELYMYE